MNNNYNTETSWLDALNFGEINLGDVYESTGVRDVLTTLANTVNEATTQDSGMSSIVGDMQDVRGELSFSDLISGAPNEEQTGNVNQVLSFSDLMQSSEAVTEDADFDYDVDDTEDEDEDDDEAFDNLGDLLSRMETSATVEQEQPRPTNRNEQGDGGMEQENTISLNELFSRQTSLADLDNQSVVTLTDIQENNQASTYTRPDLGEIISGTSTIVEFGEDVLVAKSQSMHGGVLEFGREGYEEFNNNRMDEHNLELARERQRRSEAHEQKKNVVQGILEDLFGRRYSRMYGYDKIGKTPNGLPYINAVLSTRFTKLNDRRFRKQEEMREISRNVAVANKLQSVKGFIELTIKGEENGDLDVEVLDSEGNNIPYLENKVLWLKAKGIRPDVWVLYLKTQFEFEETITSMEQLKTLDFIGE